MLSILFSRAQELEIAGQWFQAMAVYRKLLSKEPRNAQLRMSLGNLLYRLNDYETAAREYKEALKEMPTSPELWYNLGNCRLDIGDLPAARENYQKALKQVPTFHPAIRQLGVIEQKKGNFSLALEWYEKALKIAPSEPETLASIASVYTRLGLVGKAIDFYKQAVKNEGVSSAIYSNLLFYLPFNSGFSDEEVLNEFRLWNEKYALKWTKQALPHSNKPDPEKQICIGFVSPDFREHPVGHYMEHILAHLDRSTFNIFCYTNHFQADEMTKRLKEYPSITWRDIRLLSDDAAAALIRKDQIDILVDLSGHMAWNRLLLFARKPVPVQVTQTGYPGTTGLTAMDYRLTDRFMDPLGLTEKQHIEQLIRLERCAFCYTPLVDAPEITLPPFEKNGFITFGSFNNFVKVSDNTVRLWEDLLEALPDSRLHLLVQGGDLATRRFTRTDPSRIECIPLGSRKEYLERHLAVDIGLDPFPYNGGLSTLEALWMGVPIITLVGRTSASRHGVSIYENLGFTDWIAETEKDYLQKALKLARSPELIREMRTALRAHLAASILMDGKAYAHTIGEAYRTMWKSWCKKS